MCASFLCRGLIHVSNIAHALIEKVTDVFDVGEQIKMMVVNSSALNTISFRYYKLSSFLFLGSSNCMCYVVCYCCFLASCLSDKLVSKQRECLKLCPHF